MPIFEVETDTDIYEVEALDEAEAQELVLSQLDNEPTSVPSSPTPSSYTPGRGLGGAVSGLAQNRLLPIAEAAISPITQPIQRFGRAYKGFKAALAGEDTTPYKESFSEAMSGTGIPQLAGTLGHSLESAAEQASLIQHEPDFLHKAGRAAMVPLALSPLHTGSVEAGEKIAAGDTRGYGEAAFDLGTALAPGIAKGIPKIPGVSKLGSRLQKGAAQQWAEGIHPKLRYEGLAEKVGEEALDRGLWGRMSSLEKAAEKGLALEGPRIGEIIKGSEKRVSPKSYSREALEEFGRSESFDGKPQGFRDLENAAIDELDRLPEDLSLEEAWELRKIKEDPVVRKGAYLPGADPAITAKVEAQGVVADSTRKALVEAEPSLAKPMKEYNFYKNLETLLDTRKKTPETALNPFKARTLLEAVDPYRGIRSAWASTPVKTGLAVARHKIGKYLKSGNIPEAAKLSGIPEEQLQMQEQSSIPGLDESSRLDLPPAVRLQNERPEVWGADTPESFRQAPGEAAMTPREQLAEREFLKPDLESGTNADQARMLRTYKQVLAELDDIGYKPEPIPAEQLDSNRYKALEAADRKSIEAIIRTINNPTYKKLPTRAGARATKTKSDVIREIFSRNRKLAIGKKIE